VSKSNLQPDFTNKHDYHAKLAVLYDIERLNLTQLPLVLYQVNKILSSQINVHLQVVATYGVAKEIIVNNDTLYNVGQIILNQRKISFDTLLAIHGGYNKYFDQNISRNTTCTGRLSRVLVPITYIDETGDVLNWETDKIVGMTAAALFQVFLTRPDMNCKGGCPDSQTCVSDVSPWYLADGKSASSCYIEGFRNVLKYTRAYCFFQVPNPDKSVIPVCGNGIIEINETCDCHAHDNACLKNCNLENCKSRDTGPDTTMTIRTTTTKPTTTEPTIITDTQESTTYTTEPTSTTPEATTQPTSEVNTTPTTEPYNDTQGWFIILILIVISVFLVVCMILILINRKSRQYAVTNDMQMKEFRFPAVDARSKFVYVPGSPTTLSPTLLQSF